MKHNVNLCKKCGGELVFLDFSYEDDYSSGFYVCSKCQKKFEVNEVEG